jgi:hypothetical protein
MQINSCKELFKYIWHTLKVITVYSHYSWNFLVFTPIHQKVSHTWNILILTISMKVQGIPEFSWFIKKYHSHRVQSLAFKKSKINCQSYIQIFHKFYPNFLFVWRQLSMLDFQLFNLHSESPKYIKLTTKMPSFR